MVLRRLRNWAWILSALLLTACGGNSTDRTDLIDSAGALAAPSTLPKLSSAAGEHMLKHGVDYTSELPSQGCVPWDTTVKLLPADKGMAYAMFAFSLASYGGDQTIHVSLSAGAEDTFLGIADRTQDHWVWHSLAQDASVEMSNLADYVDDSDVLIAVLVTTKPSIVDWVCFGTANVPGPPQILSVTPTTAGAGEQVQMHADVSGTRPLIFNWQVIHGDTSIVNGNSATPTVTFGSEGSSIVRLSISNAEGAVSTIYSLCSLPEGSWLHTLGGWEADEFTCVASDPEGNILAGGGSGPGMFLACYSPEGTLLWQRYYECYVPSPSDPASTVMANHPMAIDFGADGSIYLLTDTALRMPDQFSQSEDSFVLKLTSAGTTVWGQHLPEMNLQGALAEQEGVVAAYLDDHYLEFSASGAELEHLRLHGPNGHFHTSNAHFSTEGELFVTGTQSGIPMATKLGAGVEPSSLEVKWSRTYDGFGGSDTDNIEVAPGSDGSLVLAGNDYSRAVVMSLDANGDVAFARSWDAGWQAVRSVDVDGAGNVIVCGGDNHQWWSTFELRRFSPVGALLNSLYLDGGQDSAAVDALPLPDGSLVIVGGAVDAGVQLLPIVTDTVDLPVTVTDIDTDLNEDTDPTNGDDMIMFSSEFVADRGGGQRDGLIMKLTGL